MLNRLRVEPPAILLFMDNLTQSFYRTARENWLHARTAHTGSLEYSYVGLHKIETFHLVSTCLHCLVSVQHFRNLVLLMLGELPVQRICAFYKYRSSLTNFCTSDFCKRSRLFCVLNSDTMVLDSEWHWILIVTNFRHSARSILIFRQYCVLSERSQFNTILVYTLTCEICFVRYRITLNVGSLELHSLARQPSIGKNGWTMCAGPPLCASF